jgi:hypothetical protein
MNSNKSMRHIVAGLLNTCGRGPPVKEKNTLNTCGRVPPEEKSAYIFLALVIPALVVLIILFKIQN